MDSRKFLNTINNSAQSRVSLYESLIGRLGQKAGAPWKLAALLPDTLFIEEANGHYYVANHQRMKGGKVQITDIRPVKIVEEQKQSLFAQNCTALVEAIEANDQRAMRTVFNNLAAQRFSPRTIPESGLVKTRDGIVRKLRVDNGNEITAEDRDKLVAALVESVSDTIVLESGRVVSASFGEDTRKRLPISEWACRRVVGNHMRTTAENAYRSPGFQNRVYKVAKLINNDSVKEAVESIKDFLAEQQEFCLLTRQEVQTLIENTLAAKSVLNQQLCTDTATLFYKTNLRVNRDTILKEWRATAQKAQHPTLLENVDALEKAKNFDGAYNTFLEMAFNEALSPRDEEVAAYRLALDMLKSSPKIQEDQELQSKVSELITKLADPEVDDATVHLVRETLAAAKQEADSLSRLSDFDQIPGDEPGGAEGGEEDLAGDLGDAAAEETAGGGGPVINVNAPLISIGGGGEDFGMGGGEDLGLGGEEDLDLGGEEDLGGDEDLGGEEDLDFGGGEEDREGEDQINLNLDSKQKRGQSAVSETVNKALGRTQSEAKWEPGEEPWNKNKKNDEGDDEGDEQTNECMDEDCDPYAFGEDINFEHGMGHDYGRPTITSEMDDVIASMVSLVEEKQLTEQDLESKIDLLATEAIAANGIKLPKSRLGSAVDQVATEFRRRLAEDQFKWGTLMRRRGMNKSRVNKKERKGYSGNQVGEGDDTAPTPTKGVSGPPPKTESVEHNTLTWLEHDAENRGILGTLNGVKFVLDYASPPMVCSEDGKSVQVPISEDLVQSAFAAAGLREGRGDDFARWLAQSIEQFRPLNEEDEKALAEAVATITAGPDGTISVAVDGDVGVEQMGDEEGMEGEMGEMGEMEPDADDMGEVGAHAEPDADEFGGAPDGDADDMGMAPVGDIGDEEGLHPEPDADEMPDFEGGEGVPEGPEPEEDEEEEEEGPPVREDKDITCPEHKGKYDTTTQDHRERPKEAGKAQKPNDGKNLEGFDTTPEKIKTDSPDTELKKVKPGKNRPQK